MTFCQVDKIRDLKQSQVVPHSKRTRLAENLVLDVSGEEPSSRIPTPMHYIHGVRILCNMWAVTGSHKVVSKRDGAHGEVIYAPLKECLHYATHVEEKLMAVMTKDPHANHSQILGWLRAADEATRTLIMELVRTDTKATIGEAITQAITECVHAWMPPARLEGTGRGPRGGGKGSSQYLPRPRTPLPVAMQDSFDAGQYLPRPSHQTQGKGGRKGGQGKGDRKGDPQDPGPIIRTGHHFKGQEICKAWNDARGCTSPCPRGKIHVCDVLVDGRVCGKSGQARWGHKNTH